jgi:hypothetical protein
VLSNAELGVVSACAGGAASLAPRPRNLQHDVGIDLALTLAHKEDRGLGLPDADVVQRGTDTFHLVWAWNIY